MTKRKTWLYILGSIAFVGALLWWLFLAPPPQTSVPEKTGGVNFSIEGSTLKEGNNGKPVWEMTIGSMDYDAEKGISQLRGIRGKWYREDGTWLDITAEGGTITKDQQELVLTGNVVATHSEGSRLETDKLTWLKTDGRLQANGKVRLMKDDVVATADEAVMDTGFVNLRLSGKAEVKKGVQS